jgi:hypothetical protein
MSMEGKTSNQEEVDYQSGPRAILMGNCLLKAMTCCTVDCGVSPAPALQIQVRLGTT